MARLAAVVLVVVHTLPAVAVSVTAGGFMGGGWCNTLAAFLGARWRPFCGPCGVVAGVGLSLPLAWPLRAARGWRWRGLDRLRVVLAAVAVWTAPAAAVAVAGASIKRARRRGPFAGLAALRWWRGQIVNELARLALLALSRLWWPWRESNPRRRWRSSNGRGLGPCGPWCLVLLGVVLLEGYKARGGAFG